ncbi:MAG: carboxypeptidase-like regulatory domain-containing protein [Planctomycetaceae bacterium]|jgi:hypothetical protein|nr:carboxypeptidase-like regulatory domain-containing protein [Planctomycetaceae bacterium]
MKKFSVKSVRIGAFICFGLLILSGCSSAKPSDLPKLVKVTLTITQDGKPLSNAVVSLARADQGGVYSASGITNENGVCSLYTHGQYKGAPLGKYKVRVSRIELIPKPLGRKPKDNAEYEAYKKNPPKTYQLVEEIYTDAKTTPLEIEITGSMQKTFDVGKAVKNIVI